MEKVHYSKGRVVDIRKENQRYGCIVQGENAKNCRDGFGCTGGHGTYLLWDGSGVNRYLFLDVSVYENQNHVTSINILEKVLKNNNRHNVNNKLVETLRQKNVGKKIQLFQSEKTGWEWRMADWDELDLKV